MRSTLSTVALLALFAIAQPALAQPQAAGAPAAGQGASVELLAQLSNLPACFTACGTQAATSPSVGCSSVTDFACICSKPAYANASAMCIQSSGANDCPSLKANVTLLQQANDLFAQLCKATMSAGNATAAGHAGMPMAGSGNTTAVNHTSTTTTAPKSNSATFVAPPMDQIVTASVAVMSVMLASVLLV